MNSYSQSTQPNWSQPQQPPLNRIINGNEPSITGKMNNLNISSDCPPTSISSQQQYSLPQPILSGEFNTPLTAQSKLPNPIPPFTGQPDPNFHYQNTYPKENVPLQSTYLNQPNMNAGSGQNLHSSSGQQLNTQRKQYVGNMRNNSTGQPFPMQPPPPQYHGGPPVVDQFMTNPQQHFSQPTMPTAYPQVPMKHAEPIHGSYPPGQYNPGSMPPQQPRRLDPDQMPNPIQVMAENQRSFIGPFITNQAGLVPPLVTTKCITHDQGNSGPKFIRSSMYNVPATADMMKQTAVPFAINISPFAKTLEGEITPPVVNFGEIGPIRCIRCKCYMSPNMQFIDAGRRFYCLLCKATTEVPQEYFQHLDHTGQRVDKFERPELILGSYEFMATRDYCRNNKPPNPPALLFLIDVSYNNIKSGLVHLLCAEMKNVIKNLPIDEGMQQSLMKIGFITYNNTVHFYNVKKNLALPQMLVVGDIQEMFMPLLDGFLCDAKESESVIDLLMEQIPAMFSDTRETETVLLPAIQAGLEALKSLECAGKLLVFHSSLPIADAPGKLKNRDDRNILGTDKEKNVLAPQSNVYNNLGQECVQNGCSVDLFIFNNSYIDLATIGQVCRLTGGEVYKYTYFQADIDGKRFISDLKKNISNLVAFDVVMRVRTSTGIRPTDFYGNLFMSNTTDIEIAAINCNQSISIEIKHDDKLSPEENVYIQVAVLYTASSGQRRLRILNLVLKICTQMADLFRCCDLDVIILHFAKQIMVKIADIAPKAIKEELENRCAQILACYRKNCASPTSAGQLILPECMKLLPLYASCLMKNDAIAGGSDMTCDDRAYAMQFVSVIDLPMSVSYFYPRLIPIHDVNPNDFGIPSAIRSSIEKMTDDGAYILENGIHMFVWLGLSLSPEFTQSVFGVPSTLQIDTDRCAIPVFENKLSHRIHSIIENIQIERPRCMRVTLIRQRDKLESVFKHFLTEDRGSNGSPSYVDYLCYLHKEIRSLLS